MNNESIETLRKQIEEVLKKKPLRYIHTIGVANTSACLAMRYGADMEKAYIAGLLHDCAKYVNDQTAISECVKYGIEITESERKGPYLLHAKLGAYYASHIYQIDDPDICDAIRSHTTGRAGMSLLEQILFVADYIEPYRNMADNLEEIRRLAFTHLESAVCQIAKDTLDYVRQTGRAVDPITKETYDYYNRLVQNQ